MPEERAKTREGRLQRSRVKTRGGIRDFTPDTWRLSGASTEPRENTRRNRATAPTAPPRPRCFNGAA